MEKIMNRRQTLKWLGGLSTFLLPIPATQMAIAREEKSMKLVKSKSEWAALLPLPAFRVLFEEDTERAGTSPLNNEKRDGTFICAACFLPLFDSRMKYESTGLMRRAFILRKFFTSTTRGNLSWSNGSTISRRFSAAKRSRPRFFRRRGTCIL
jgi:hypothetical protein